MSASPGARQKQRGPCSCFTERKPCMTFTEAAAQVLRLVGKPLHYKEITDIAIEKNLLSHVGKSPEVTIGARLAATLKKESPENPLVRVKPGVFALRVWDEKTIKSGLDKKGDRSDRGEKTEKVEKAEKSEPRGRKSQAPPPPKARAKDDDDEVLVASDDDEQETVEVEAAASRAASVAPRAVEAVG